MSTTYRGVTFYEEGDRVAYRPDPAITGTVIPTPYQRDHAREDEAWVEWCDGVTTLEDGADLVLRAPHDCGVCDGPLRFVGYVEKYRTWVCLDCGGWHIGKDCCERTEGVG